MFEYKIDKDNAVWGYITGQEVAILFQPYWPNGDAFTNKDDAKLFADGWLAHMTDAGSNEFPTSRPE